ncbi:MAG: hypothetical protein JJU36_11745 [Phycisphaeraceae bacterium]|nr:hypothetical protein [Phycisphaeraceae bacterium]
MIDHIGSVSWNHTLGFSWDRDFSLGGIVGKANATVIPRIEIPIPFAPNIVIPAVTADTRTGARFSGNIAGGIGLDFFADFSASGLAPGNLFDFKPTVTAPGAIVVGDFFRLSTTAGLQSDPAFTADRVQLPSFEAGMDLLFDLAINGKIEGGLFPIVPYGSANIAMDEPWSINQSLVNFGFDLNPGTAQPPTLTFLKDTFIEQTYAVVDPDLSSMSLLLSYGPPTNRIDLGEIELINPFGSEQSIIGGSKPNLTINTSMNASSVGFSFETPLLRMGLDLDGIAGYLVTGAFGYPTSAVTRLDLEIDDLGGVYLELLDIKYGPEIGYREQVEVRPDFLVTLNFDQTVIVRTATGFRHVNQFTGLWSDLPEFALLSDTPVQVSVNFDALLGEQAKRGSFFLTDYLQVTVLEGGLSLFDSLDLTFPPLLQFRTSLLGLLGEVEMDVFHSSQAISPIPLENMGGSFTLQPRQQDPRLLYWASPADDNLNLLDRWAALVDHTQPDSFDAKFLIVARGDQNAVHVGELLPMTLIDPGTDDDSTIRIDELRIPAGSALHQSGERRWAMGVVQSPVIRNDGLYYSDGLTEFHAGVIGRIQIEGTGEMRFTDRVHIEAHIIHRFGHTIRFQELEELTISEDWFFSNAGAVIFESTTATLHGIADTYDTGSFEARQGSIVTLTGPQLHQGRVAAIDPDSQIILTQGTTIYPVDFEGTRGGFVAAGGGRIYIDSPTIIGAPTWSSFEEHLEAIDARRYPIWRVTFKADEGGTVEFNGQIEQSIGSGTRFEIAEGGTMVLSGTTLSQGPENTYPQTPGSLIFDARGRLDPKFAYTARAMASQIFVVENHGTLNVFGHNPLYIDVLFDDGVWDPIHGSDRRVLSSIDPNLINTGRIIIHPDSSFSFQQWVDQYDPKRMTFEQGTWELHTGAVVHVENISIDPGLDLAGWYMAISDSNVTLGGNARFDFLNTIEENRGRLTLQNNHHFTAAGDLLNRGEIRIESGAKLELPNARLMVDEGSVFIDGAAGASLIGAATIEVMGGSFTNELAAGPVDIAERWIVREKWLGQDAQGNDIIRPATVSFGEAHIERILASGGITLDGSEAAMAPLAGLTDNAGLLAITGGNVLELGQDLFNTDTGRLEITRGGQLHIDGSLTSHGEMWIGPQGYLATTMALHLKAGSAMIDGIIDTPMVTIDENVAVSGSTLLTGALANHGHLAVGSSPGIMEVFGGITQSSTGTITFELFGQAAGESYDRLILHADGTFEGGLTLMFGHGFEPCFGQQWLLVDLRQSAEEGVPPRKTNWWFHEIEVTGLATIAGDLDLDALKWYEDDLLLGGWNDMAIFLSFGPDHRGNLTVYSIPEPGGWLILAGLAVWWCRRPS